MTYPIVALDNFESQNSICKTFFKWLSDNFVSKAKLEYRTRAKIKGGLIQN